MLHIKTQSSVGLQSLVKKLGQLIQLSSVCQLVHMPNLSPKCNKEFNWVTNLSIYLHLLQLRITYVYTSLSLNPHGFLLTLGDAGTKIWHLLQKYCLQICNFYTRMLIHKCACAYYLQCMHNVHVLCTLIIDYKREPADCTHDKIVCVRKLLYMDANK